MSSILTLQVLFSIPKLLSDYQMKNSLSSTQSIRAIDLFCGIGGNSLGAQQVGVEIVAGFDKWGLATSVYQENFPRAHTFTADLRELDPAVVRENIGPIDLILASPECTSHSVARGNKARLVHSLELAFQVTRFSEIFKPRWILIENVPHMQSWERYDEFLATLRHQGYKIHEQILLASDFGVPQSRKRLYILCDRQKPPQTIVPQSDVEMKSARTIINLNGKYKMTPLDNGHRAEKTLIRAKRGIDIMGEDTPFLMVYYGSGGTGNGGWQSLDVPLRTITTLDRFAIVKPGPNGEGPVMRMLQPAELQAAMGFPETFIMNRGSRRDKIHLLGNAVCPPVIKIIVETLVGKEKLQTVRQVVAEPAT